MLNKIRAPSYTGGKSAYNRNPAFIRWLHSLLPYRKRYAEPFAGMLGVLLAREPSKVEVVNDLDGRVANWWRVVRDEGDKLRERFDASPVYCREFFDEARTGCNEKGFEGAYYFTLLLSWASFHKYDASSATLYMSWSDSADHRLNGRRPQRYEFERLMERMRNVAVENMCAVKMLERLARFEDCVIYCDPPYSVASANNLYRYSELDVGALTEVLLAQKGAVLISGYGSEWDHLGWNRSEHSAHASIANTRGKTQRVEVVWANYDYSDNDAIL